MVDKEPESLGAYIRTAREHAGLSLRQLATTADINYGYLARVESGERSKPAPDVLQRLADALAVDAADLFAFVGVRPEATLPSTRTYFRRKLGVDAEEAEILAQLIENYQANKEGGNDHESTNQGGSKETD